MKFCWSTLFVKNLDESIRFYKEIVGLDVVNRLSAGPNMEIAFLGEGETKIELICDASKKQINIGTDISWGFKVENLDSIIAMLTQKNISVSGPFMPNPKSRFIFIKDPNGMNIQFYQSI